MFYRNVRALGIIIWIVGWLLNGCGPNTLLPISDQALVNEPFVEQNKGYTVRYPSGWMLRWEDHGGVVRFL